MRGSLVPRSRAFTVHLPFIAGLAVVAAVGSAALSALPAAAVQASQATLVSPVPAPQTPDVNDGRVNAIAQVGDEIILGGTFTSASPAGDLSTTYPLANTLAFDATTGDLDTTGYLPSVNGEVDTAIAGPAPDEVYLGGKFTTVDGRPMAVALVSTRTGQLVPTWHPSALNGSVSRLVLAGGHLFVAGTFTKAGADRHGGLVALDPATGHATSYVNFSFTGHHNYGSQCDPDTSKCATGRVGVKAIDVNPAGTHLVVIGDFTEVAGFSRDQIAMLNLGTPSATVDASWATLAYTSPCLAHSFDSYVRDVQFSPDGGYFVVTATGGIGTNRDGTKSSCDAAARYETNASGANVRPTWIDYTGEDSLWTVALTGTAIYVGGHERWLNNSLGQNQAGPGAVPRPGIAALSPSNGLPLSWNPGREPRGAGCFALLATPAGLWIGSDTDYIGNRTYLRERVAFFPLAGGVAVPDASTAPLPGRVYLAGTASTYTADPDRLIYREFNGVTLGAEEPVSSGLPWGSVDGAFTVDGEVIYGKPDGSLYERSFDGSTFGDEVQLDPYDDPLWDDVQTGSGQTYQGQPSTFAAEIPSVTSMFFRDGRLFYTLAGKSAMDWRWFEPESGIVGADEFTVSGTNNWSDVAGAFLASGKLYYASRANGELWAVPWSGLKPAGVPTLVDAATDWASRGLLLLAQSDAPVATPTAEFTATCNGTATCSFDAMPYLDPDGGVVRYGWDFGDGTAQALSPFSSTTHTYTTDGTHKATLTVEVTAGASATTSQTIEIARPIEKVAFVGASKVTSTGTKARIKVPVTIKPGEALLMFDSFASNKKVIRPSGWTMIRETKQHALTTVVYERVATASDAGRVVTVRYAQRVHSSLVLAGYRNTSVHPIEMSAVSTGLASRRHRAPSLHRLTTGTWVVGLWSTVGSRPASWVTPKGLKRRVGIHSARRPAVGILLADTGKPCAGTCVLGSAWSKRRSTAAAQWAIALAPALG